MSWFKKVFGSSAPPEPTAPSAPDAGEPGDSWFEGAWHERDKALFEVFGEPMRGQIALPPMDLVEGICGMVDPRWLHQGVYVFEPSDVRSTFAYCTAGLSTAWDRSEPPADPSVVDSGLGLELCMTLDRFDGWAIDSLMKLMFYQVAVAAGRKRGRAIEASECIPMSADLVPTDSTLRAFATAVHETKGSFVVSSGVVELVQLVGMTERELAWFAEKPIVGSVEIFLEAYSREWGRKTVTSRRDIALPPHVERSREE